MWRDKMEEFGHPHAHLTPPMAKGIYVTPTMEEALHDPIGLDDFSSRILRSARTTGATIGMPTDKDGKLPRGMRPGPRVNRTESGGMILAMPVCRRCGARQRSLLSD